MDFANGVYNARVHSSKSNALLQEGASRRSDYMPFAKYDGKQTLGQGSSQANNSYTSNSPSVQTRSSRASWLNSFLHKSSRYVDYLATQEAFNRTNSTCQNVIPPPMPAADAGAALYSQMRRISSRPPLSSNSGIVPFSLEWALDELLAADKWLHEKYVSSRAPKDSVRGQAGDGDDNVTDFPTRVLGRGDSYGTHEADTSHMLHGLDIVAENTVNLLGTAEENGRHLSNTLPRNLKNLFAVGKPKTPSTCSLPDTSRMEVIGRFLATEG